MSPRPLIQFGPSTMPLDPQPGLLLLHIKASLQELVDRSR